MPPSLVDLDVYRVGLWINRRRISASESGSILVLFTLRCLLLYASDVIPTPACYFLLHTPAPERGLAMSFPARSFTPKSTLGTFWVD